MRITALYSGLGRLSRSIGVAGRSGHHLHRDAFQLRNTGDLRELCSSTPSDPLFTPAQNFCQGFMVGVFRVLQEEDMALRSRHLFCMPKAMPTRNEAIASFVQWARANPDQIGQPAVDGVARFLSQQYPCGHVG